MEIVLPRPVDGEPARDAERCLPLRFHVVWFVQNDANSNEYLAP